EADYEITGASDHGSKDFASQLEADSLGSDEQLRFYTAGG
ncbi:hypothetical protein A2U01_0114386, partial [Trifolium medium]|nr:hypothetical protein [Trifolium medium]